MLEVIEETSPSSGVDYMTSCGVLVQYCRWCRAYHRNRKPRGADSLANGWHHHKQKLPLRAASDDICKIFAKTMSASRSGDGLRPAVSPDAQR